MTARRFPSVAVWAISHSLTPTSTAIVIVGWLLSALTCHLALPRIAPTTEPQTVDLQLFGLVALAATAGATSLLFHDGAPWLPASSPRRIALVRAGWAGFILLGTLIAGLLSTLLVPTGLPRLSGYLAVGLLWWAVAVLAVVAGGQLAGLLSPLALAVVFTNKVVPWEVNLVFQPNLDTARLVAGSLGVLIAVASYTLFGSAHDRRLRAVTFPRWSVAPSRPSSRSRRS